MLERHRSVANKNNYRMLGRMVEITGLLVCSLVFICLSSFTHPFCTKVFPLIYHEIEVEIPNDSRPLIWHIYYLWLILCGTLVINMIACIFILISGSSDGGRDLGSSIGYGIL